MSQVSQDMPFVVDIASKASDLIHPIDTHLGVVGRCCTKETGGISQVSQRQEE